MAFVMAFNQKATGHVPVMQDISFRPTERPVRVGSHLRSHVSEPDLAHLTYLPAGYVLLMLILFLSFFL